MANDKSASKQSSELRKRAEERLHEKSGDVSSKDLHDAQKLIQGLNHVHPFGLDIFHTNLGAINHGAEGIVYSGDRAPDFTIPYAHASI